MYHFIGIKGSGMSALATILYDKGEVVQGSDVDDYIFTQDPLIARSIKVLSFDENNIKDNMIVIIGGAFNKSNVEVSAAMNNDSVKTYYYHEFLGMLQKEFTAISVAGTHGKTTTTTLISKLMNEFKPCSYLIGDGTGCYLKDSEYFVLESCEFKDHFLNYEPDYAIITNIDLDHIDFFPTLDRYIASFEKFANQVKKCVVLFGDDENIRKLNVKTDTIYYGLNEDNDLVAKNVIQNSDGIEYDAYYKGEFYMHVKLDVVGIYMVWNSLGAIAISIAEGLDKETISKGLSKFKHANRRFSIEYNKDNVYIDDYAHHPTAIKLTLETARIKFPDKKIVAVYKPDRYSRLERFLDDFVDALTVADDVYLTNFLPNTDREGLDITIEDLRDKIENCKIVSEDIEGAKLLDESGPACYIFMSTKDVYKIKNILKNFQ